MVWKNLKRGVTLIEVLIAMGIFSVVAVLSTTILVDTVNLEKKTSVQNAIYEDMRTILQQITYMVQSGTIDYEEYYNYYVIQGGGADGAGDVVYGKNYGVYASRFYDPGESLVQNENPDYLSTNPYDLGVECSFPSPLAEDEECEVTYTLSIDLNTGQNPFDGSDPDAANAFCENYNEARGNCENPGVSDQLFLIDSSGTTKTIIGRKRTSINDDHAIGILRLTGSDGEEKEEDDESDQNGIIDTFTCSKGYVCTSPPNSKDLGDTFDIETPASAFVPFSPLRADIKELQFIINPLEDPYKAYAEPEMRVHPSVTIVMTVGLSSAAAENYPGDFEDITIQTTVAAGIVGKLDSYPPIEDVKNQGAASWIKGVGGDEEGPLYDESFTVPLP